MSSAATYASLQELKDAVPAADLESLTDHDGSEGAIVEAKLIAALEDATAQINSYIGRRASLPLSAPPRMLAVVCRDLALYRLYANAGRVTEDVARLHKSSIAYLSDVAEGKLSLGDEDAADTVEASPGAVFTEGDAPVMTRESLKGF
ncbi:MAG: DUF1320 domain-containing protein [Pseudomonadota bacterium]